MQFLATLFMLLAGLSTNQVLAQSIARDDFDECHRIRKLVVKDEYQVRCYRNYHHYNSAVAHHYRTGRTKWVEMANFNLWQPGSRSSSFKDYGLLAKLINGYDLVSALELLPNVGADNRHNQKVLKFLDEMPDKLKELKADYQESPSAELKTKIEKLEDTIKKAGTLYRKPDYLKLLTELRKLDKSWSLLLSPTAEAAEEISVHEFTGFYYKARTVKPVINEHCLEHKRTGHGNPIACYPQLTSRFLGTSAQNVFSRRPFMASFKSGRFDFTLLTSHVIFTSPSDPEKMARILKPAFGVTNYLELGTGVTKANYARFAEMKIISKLINKIQRKYKEKDVFYMGDTNIEMKNPFWDNFLLDGNHFLYIDDPTTITVRRFDSRGNETNGESNDFDHLLLDEKASNECVKSSGEVDAKRIRFYDGHISTKVREKYFLRRKGSLTPLSSYKSKMNTILKNLETKLRKELTIKRNEIVLDEEEIQKKLEDFKTRVLLSQFDNDTFYRVYKEVLSDHFPIAFSCKRQEKDDD